MFRENIPTMFFDGYCEWRGPDNSESASFYSALQGPKTHPAGVTEKRRPGDQNNRWTLGS